MEKVITIFGSGLLSPEDKLYKDTFEIGRLLAKNGYVVCTGGYSGSMEAVSMGAKSAGGKTYGVTVSIWETIPNKYIDEETKMPNLMERLTELIALGDAYVVLKGGSGTLAEIAIVLELMNKRMMKEKKIIFYTPFWRNVIETIKPDNERLRGIIERNVVYAETPAEVIEKLNL
jgi:uncharacterized protein (TIGR00730 family)